MPEHLHVDLDRAWPDAPAPRHDATPWGPRLRYLTRERELQRFAAAVPFAAPRFVLYGSGDFHHLSAVRVRARAAEPLDVVSFDNHPDWDRRPPRWACGAWVNRALDAREVRRVTVWGCGNFELELPWRLFADRAALRTGRLAVRPWGHRFKRATAARFGAITWDGWRAAFEAFADGLRGRLVYVTVDLDCLRGDEAATNWEPGEFAAADVAWALRRLHESARVTGGDVCGAWSPPRYARVGQRVAGGWDHPRSEPVDPVEAHARNAGALREIWPALLGD